MREMDGKNGMQVGEGLELVSTSLVLFYFNFFYVLGKRFLKAPTASNAPRPLF